MTEQQSPNDSPPEQEPASSPRPAQSTSSSGLEPNIAGALSYLLTWLTGLIFLLIEKEDKFVRFHAVQAIGLGVAWIVAWIVLSVVAAILPGILGTLVWILGWLAVGLGGLVIWLFMMFKAYQGQMVKLPIIGDIAEKESNKLQK